MTPAAARVTPAAARMRLAAARMLPAALRMRAGAARVTRAAAPTTRAAARITQAAARITRAAARTRQAAARMTQAAARVTSAAALALLLLLAGCHVQDPLRVWQQSVEAYALARGDGDLGVLQSAGQSGLADDPRPALPLVSTPEVLADTPAGPAPRSAHGVLLGLARSGGRLWYVFALGICAAAEAGQPGSAERILDVRIAAISGGPRAYRWRISDADAAQLQRYRAQRTPPWPAFEVRAAFPRAADDFVLLHKGGAVNVLERSSGASWELLLEDEPAQR